jgi:hypothetical protein
MPDKVDGLRDIVNNLKKKDRDSTILFTEEEIMEIRHGQSSEEDRKALFDAVRERPGFQAPGAAAHASRPEMIAREGQENMTSDQLADLLMLKLQVTPQHKIPFTGTKVNVNSWSNATRTFRCWGDYWAWMQLGRAFTELGYHFNVDPGISDVTVYLRGGRFKTDDHWQVPNRINPNTHNIVWIYSHPDDISSLELRDYDEVWCLSQKMVDQVQAYGHKGLVETPITSCTNMVEPSTVDDRFDVVFIGNARGQTINEDGRDVIQMLKDRSDLNVGIYGMKWDLPHLSWVVDRGWWQGDYYAYYKLPRLYSGAKVVLNDTHPDMARFGFIPMKLFDIIRSGGFPITDGIAGLEEKLPEIAVYESKKNLNDLIDYYLEESDERTERQRDMWYRIKDDTFTARAAEAVESSHYEGWKSRESVSQEMFDVHRVEA